MEMQETANYRLTVNRHINRKFKLHFLKFVFCDAELLLASVGVAFFDPLAGVTLMLFLVPRIALGMCIVFWKVSILPLYTKITFHRESFLRRFSNWSHHPILPVWIGYSCISSAFIVLIAVVFEVAHVVVIFGTEELISGVISLASLALMLFVAWWLVASELFVYSHAVIRNVDNVLNSQELLRKSYVIASANHHNAQIRKRFDAKNNFISRQNQALLLRSGGLGSDTQSAR